MDILYVLGKGSNWENKEILYSLRTVEKYCKNVNRIFITGDFKPNFLNNRVIFNKCSDVDKERPNVNTLEKILWTIKNTDISENFLLMNDDYFFTKSVDIKKYPFACKGELRKINDNKTKYRQTEIETRFFLESIKKPILNYCVHCPLIINSKEFLDLEDTCWKKLRESKNGLLHRSVYCNFYKKEPFLREDCKVYDIGDIEDLKKKIQPYDCFSSSDESLYKGVIAYLFFNVTERSKYEI